METHLNGDWRARIAAIDPTIANFRLADEAQVHVHEDRIVFKHKVRHDRSAPADELAFFFDVERSRDRNRKVNRWQVLQGGWGLERQARFALRGLPDLCYCADFDRVGADSAALVALALSIVGRRGQFLTFAPTESGGCKIPLPEASADSSFTWSDDTCCYAISGASSFGENYLIVGRWSRPNGLDFYPELFVGTRFSSDDAQWWEVFASDGTVLTKGNIDDPVASLSTLVNLVGEKDACHRLVRRRDDSVVAARLRELAGDELVKDGDPLRWVSKLRESLAWNEARVQKLEAYERRCADLEQTLTAAKTALDAQERLDRLRGAIREALKPGASAAAWQRLAGELA